MLIHPGTPFQTNRLPLLALAVCMMSVAGGNALSAALPEGASVSPKGALVLGTPATGKVHVELPLKPGQSTRIALQLGKEETPLVISLPMAHGRVATITLTAKPTSFRTKTRKVLTFDDASIRVRIAKGRKRLLDETYSVRPKPNFGPRIRKDVRKNWASYPPATAHKAEIRLDVQARRLSLWLNGRYIETLSSRTAFGSVKLALSPGQVLHGVVATPLTPTDPYVTVHTPSYALPGKTDIERVSLPPGRRRVGGVPFDVAAPKDVIDVGKVKWTAMFNDYTDYYYTRNALDVDPDSVLLRVPTAYYSHAHFLCVVDPDPNKAPRFTVRTMRNTYRTFGGHGDAVADVTVRLPVGDKPLPDYCRKVGEVALKSPAGVRKVPLLLVSVPLKLGDVQDLISVPVPPKDRSDSSLDVELTRELGVIKGGNHGHFSIKPVGRPSAAQVLAVTLEKAPVQVQVTSMQPGNIFYAAERPSLRARMRNAAEKAFSGTLAYEVTDFYGAAQKKSMSFTVPPKAGGKEPFVLDVPLGEAVGWYSARMRFRDVKGRLFWERATTYAVLPPDTRKAGPESPYGIWWFRRGHNGTGNLHVAGPMIRRLGFRHVSPSRRDKLVGKDYAKYGLTYSMFPWYRKCDFDKLRKLIAAHPGVTAAIIGHETPLGGKTQYAPEFTGESVIPLDEKDLKSLNKWWPKLTATGKFYRDNFPHIKLIYGNSTSRMLVESFRRGYPKKYIDYIGMEDVGQAVPPEAPPDAFKAAYWDLKAARKYGYDAPVTSCYEWRYRTTRPGDLTWLQQAQLYVRDCLGALAFRMPHINPALLYDAGNGYFRSRWGATGVCRRYPLLNPKPAYLALSTMTLVLDRAEFVRLLDTPSTSLYAMEFEQDGNRVYAAWLPRGEREAIFRFAEDGPVVVTDMMGRAKTLVTKGRKATVTLSGSPTYLRSRAPVVAVDAGPTRLGTQPREKSVVLDKMDSLDRWRISTARDEELEKPFISYPRRPGKFDVAVKPDPEKGKALRLKLLPQPDVPYPYARYVSLKLKDAKPIAGRPTRFGVWVKGNSSWGRVRWEFADATGQRFYALGGRIGAWDVYDWVGHTWINFDGWNYVSLEIPSQYPCGRPRPASPNWRVMERRGPGPRYPLKFVRLVIELRDLTYYLTDFAPVKDRAIMLRDLTVEYAPWADALMPPNVNVDRSERTL